MYSSWHIFSLGRCLSGNDNISLHVHIEVQIRRYAVTLNTTTHYFSAKEFIHDVSGTQVCGFKPGRSRWIFTGVKILSMPSSGGEVKESVPCPPFRHVKETSNLGELRIAS